MSRPLSEADLYLVMLEAIEEGLNIDLQPFPFVSGCRSSVAICLIKSRSP